MLIGERYIGEIERQCAAIAHERFADLLQFTDPRTDDAAFESESDGLFPRSAFRNLKHDHDLVRESR